ncbi:MAG: hypothetical protein EZS28_022705 [Streblomastix strix]|uniref:Uncharacterized protein n=1 Tax=Streblomastix strix TaxID=222440 RepID=A0A5J4VHD2_9EUKA|nr:MAG: hypothetical protein EZS28_022705 [Streblomastix strix]
MIAPLKVKKVNNSILRSQKNVDQLDSQSIKSFKAGAHIEEDIDRDMVYSKSIITAETRKVFKEESIWNLNHLLKVIEIEATHLSEITELKFMDCVMSSIMAFSTLRLSEILWWLHELRTIATAEQASKAVRCIMKLAEIDNSYSVTSIRSASIMKAIAQGATMEEIDRISRRKDGPRIEQVFYDNNLNDEIRERHGSFQ